MFQLPDRGSKRRHDEADLGAATSPFDCRKKPRASPRAIMFQPSASSSTPFSSYQLHPGSPLGLLGLTPAQSDDSSNESTGPPSGALPPAADMVMQDCPEDNFQLARFRPDPPANPLSQPSQLGSPFHHDPSNGRLPTPIHSNLQFKPGSRASNHLDTMEMDVARTSYASSNSSRTHRAPSPINEDDSGSTPTDIAGSRLSRLSFEPDENMDLDGPDPEEPRVSPRTGRARSGAILGKKKFVMGFQPNCKLCRERVPGHNAHFLPL
ncbi:hypothetical protein K490DRAFT_66530 [Saccharata proteae CBS 121410]|uniref:Uncharacterized protein n=1 Tax=Saccharata proteae CBS 121410 TaxID=1314787 RepID=A0A9P4LW63_9PEZI|nr:hypothetical protein K490DRAFT_66530 [Saccharata proteae CBS 121410]